MPRLSRTAIRPRSSGGLTRAILTFGAAPCNLGSDVGSAHNTLPQGSADAKIIVIRGSPCGDQPAKTAIHAHGFRRAGGRSPRGHMERSEPLAGASRWPSALPVIDPRAGA